MNDDAPLSLPASLFSQEYHKNEKSTIEKYALRHCAYLERVRIPTGCAIDDHAFDDCGIIFLFSADSAVKTCCDNHEDCVYMSTDNSSFDIPLCYLYFRNCLLQVFFIFAIAFFSFGGIILHFYCFWLFQHTEEEKRDMSCKHF